MTIPARGSRIQSYVSKDIATDKYYWLNNITGAVLSNTVFETVLQAALNAKGTIYLEHPTGGNLTFSGSFAGVDVSSDTYLSMNRPAGGQLVVPNLYAGDVFRISAPDESSHKTEIILEGGKIMEAGAPVGQDWTFIKLDTPDNTFPGGGIARNTFRDWYVKYCKYGVHFSISGTEGWANSNYFENIWIDYPECGYFFDHSVTPPTAGARGCNANRFINCSAQSYRAGDGGAIEMTHGFKDISGYDNSFHACNVWDTVQGIAVADCNLTQYAFNTVISGGMMTRVPTGDWSLTQDKGTNTIVDSDWWLGQHNTICSPFLNKTGMFQGVGTANTNAIGDGLLSGIGTGGGTLSVGTDSSGIYKRGATGTTSGTRTGVRSSTFCSSRGMNLYVKMKVRLNQLTDCRAFIGILNSTDPALTGEDLLNALHGWGIGFSPTSSVSATNWVFYHNDGSGAGTAVNTNIAADTSAHIFYFAANDTVPKVGYRIDNNDAVYVTTDLPGQFNGIAPGATIINTTTADKTIDNYMWYLKQAGK